MTSIIPCVWVPVYITALTSKLAAQTNEGSTSVQSRPGFYSLLAKMSLIVNANHYYTSCEPLVLSIILIRQGNFVGKLKLQKNTHQNFTPYAVFVNMNLNIRN